METPFSEQTEYPQFKADLLVVVDTQIDAIRANATLNTNYASAIHLPTQLFTNDGKHQPIFFDDWVWVKHNNSGIGYRKAKVKFHQGVVIARYEDTGGFDHLFHFIKHGVITLEEPRVEQRKKQRRSSSRQNRSAPEHSGRRNSD